MANHKSAIKKYRRDEKLRIINKMNRSKMRNKIKLFKKKVDSKEYEEAEILLPKVIYNIDKTLIKGTIQRKTGARYKSRLNNLLKKSNAEA